LVNAKVRKYRNAGFLVSVVDLPTATEGQRMNRIFHAMATLLSGVLVGIGPVSAQQTYPTPWCMNSPGLGKECYQNLAQCQQGQQGNGGFCSPTKDLDPQQPMGYGPFPQRPNQ